jgi:protein tyrosine/serine phosphatase
MMFRGMLILTLLLSLPIEAEIRVRPHEWAQPMLGSELANFYRLSDEVYRSRQPDVEDMVALQRMGVRSILNLREYHSDEDDAKGTQLKLYRVPVNAGKIDDSFVVSALRVIDGAEKPILIHCWHGSDRTGVVVAMYRMIFQDWSREQAIDEFVNGGYGYHAGFYPNIQRYLATVNIMAIRRQISEINNE